MVEKDSTLRIREAIDRFSERRVNRQLMLASSPDAAKKIAESLPGVKDLIEIGPEAGPAALDLLTREAANDNQLVTIALYVLWKIPAATTTETLARHLVSREFSGINAELAAEVFLNSTGVEAPHEDRFTTALREAKKLVNKNPPQKK